MLSVSAPKNVLVIGIGRSRKTCWASSKLKNLISGTSFRAICLKIGSLFPQIREFTSCSFNDPVATAHNHSNPPQTYEIHLCSSLFITFQNILYMKLSSEKGASQAKMKCPGLLYYPICKQPPCSRSVRFRGPKRPLGHLGPSSQGTKVCRWPRWQWRHRPSNTVTCACEMMEPDTTWSSWAKAKQYEYEYEQYIDMI